MQDIVAVAHRLILMAAVQPASAPAGQAAPAPAASAGTAATAGLPPHRVFNMGGPERLSRVDFALQVCLWGAGLGVCVGGVEGQGLGGRGGGGRPCPACAFLGLGLGGEERGRGLGGKGEE